MINIRHYARLGVAALALTSLGACAQNGLGSVLGSVLGGQQGNSQVSGTVRGVDTRNAQIVLQQSNGQQVGISYDNQTKIVFNNQNYSVSSLESGDQVTVRLQQTQNGGYYTDYVQVDQSVSTSNRGVYNGSGGGVYSNNGAVQSLQGTVRRVDVANGWFEIAPNNGTVLTVTLPSNVARSDINRFQNLRQGDVVRFNGVYLNNARVELRQFY